MVSRPLRQCVALVFVLVSCRAERSTIRVEQGTNLASAIIERVAPVDATHAIVSYGLPGSGGRYSLAFVTVGATEATWSLTPPCDPTVQVEVTVGADVATVFCGRPGGKAAVAMGFDVTSGRTLWVSDDVPLEGPRRLEARRVRDVVLEQFPGHVAARDARTGKVRWSATETLEDVVGMTAVTSTNNYEDIVARDLVEGTVRFRVKGMYCGASDDAVFYSRFTEGSFDGVAMTALDGSAPRMVAPAADLPAGGTLRCAAYRGDLIVRRDPPSGSDRVLLRVHDGAVVAQGTLEALEFVWPPTGWERALPRFVPWFSRSADELVIVDVESAKVVRRARYSKRQPGVAYASPTVRARIDDRFVLSDDRGCEFVVDGATGRANAPAECVKNLVLTAAGTWGASAKGGLAEVELSDSSDVSRTLNAANPAPSVPE